MAARDAGSAMSRDNACWRTVSAEEAASSIVVVVAASVGAAAAPAAGAVVVVVATAPARVAARARVSSTLSRRILDVIHTVPCNDAPAVASDWRRVSTGLRSTPLTAITSTGTPGSWSRRTWVSDWSANSCPSRTWSARLRFSSRVRLMSLRTELRLLLRASTVTRSITVDPITIPIPRARKTATRDTTWYRRLITGASARSLGG